MSTVDAGAEAEVQTGIVCGDVARLAHGFLHLYFCRRSERTTLRSDGAAVAFCSVQANLDPVIAWTERRCASSEGGSF